MRRLLSAVVVVPASGVFGYILPRLARYFAHVVVPPQFAESRELLLLDLFSAGMVMLLATAITLVRRNYDPEEGGGATTKFGWMPHGPLARSYAARLGGAFGFAAGILFAIWVGASRIGFDARWQEIYVEEAAAVMIGGGFLLGLLGWLGGAVLGFAGDKLLTPRDAGGLSAEQEHFVESSLARRFPSVTTISVPFLLAFLLFLAGFPVLGWLTWREVDGKAAAWVAAILLTAAILLVQKTAAGASARLRQRIAAREQLEEVVRNAEPGREPGQLSEPSPDPQGQAGALSDVTTPGALSEASAKKQST